MEQIGRQFSEDAQAQQTGGRFNHLSMLHQYGAGGQDALLMSYPGTEPVSAQSGQWGYFRVLPAGDQRILVLGDRQQPRIAESR
jgi:hypothetical protein